MVDDTRQFSVDTPGFARENRCPSLRSLGVRMETRLRLLMRDGALDLQFCPELSGDQYDALLSASNLADTRDELRDVAKRLATDWQSDVAIDE